MGWKGKGREVEGFGSGGVLLMVKEREAYYYNGRVHVKRSCSALFILGRATIKKKCIKRARGVGL